MLPSFSIPLVQFHSAFDIPGGPLIRRGDRWEDDVQLGLVSWVMGTGVILSCSAGKFSMPPEEGELRYPLQSQSDSDRSSRRQTDFAVLHIPSAPAFCLRKSESSVPMDP